MQHVLVIFLVANEFHFYAYLVDSYIFSSPASPETLVNANNFYEAPDFLTMREIRLTLDPTLQLANGQTSSHDHP
jgi:hypothetical protein